MSNEFLQHHGILGQRWGVRRYQNPDGSLTKAGKERYSGNAIPPNTKFLKDYSGPAYFISNNDSLSELNPRVPDNYFTKNGYEDNTTPRISFAPSVDKCLAGLSQNVEGNTYSVYKPIDISKHKVFKPNPKAVPDSSITDELWICEPVKLEKVGSIKVTGNRGQAGKTFAYGDKTAELYDDWTYEMKEIQHSNLYLQHHGILGQRWGVRRFQNPDGSLTSEGKKRYSEITRYGIDGGVIPKGTTLHRVSIHEDDPTFDNKKYVSTNEFDNALWEDYLVNANKQRNRDTYAIKYQTMKDIKVAPDTVLGQKYIEEWTKNPKNTQISLNQAKNFFKDFDSDKPMSTAEAASLSIAAQTELGRNICNQLLNEGYDAVSDTHGANTSYDPLIILNPDKNLRKVSATKYKY